jgi:hypothetical protein
VYADEFDTILYSADRSINKGSRRERTEYISTERGVWKSKDIGVDGQWRTARIYIIELYPFDVVLM